MTDPQPPQTHKRCPLCGQFESEQGELFVHGSAHRMHSHHAGRIWDRMNLSAHGRAPESMHTYSYHPGESAWRFSVTINVSCLDDMMWQMGLIHEPPVWEIFDEGISQVRTWSFESVPADIRQLRMPDGKVMRL